jgi:hypothetical protein
VLLRRGHATGCLSRRNRLSILLPAKSIGTTPKRA